MIALAVTITLALAGSFLCSLSEAALYSTSDTRVASMIAEGRHGAKLLQRLRGNLDRAIAAILTTNTIANILGASIAGAIIADRFGNAYVGAFGGVFTIVILLVAEIIPKSLGATRSDYFAPRAAFFIQGLIFATFPLVLVCEWVARSVNRTREIIAPTEHEILAMTKLAARHGEMEIDTARVVHNAIKLDRVPVRDIMTPRSVVFALPDKLPLSMIEQHSEHWTHSRLPLVRDANPNEIVGIVHRRDVFDVLVRDEEAARVKTLADLKRPVMFVRDDVPADEALHRFLSGRQHMFIVVDEFGLWIGLITLEDVLEQLLGREIVGEHDPVADMQELALRRAHASHGDRVIEADEEDDPNAPHPTPAEADAHQRPVEDQLIDEVPIAIPPPNAGSRRPSTRG